MAVPVVYSCSGCSSAAQAANWVALWLDRCGEAEMSCIAGVGGGVGPLMKRLREAERVVAIDGCPLACTLACLRGAGRLPDVHVELTRYGVGKRTQDSFNSPEVGRALEAVRGRMAEAGLARRPS